MAAIINSNSFILTTAPNARRSFDNNSRRQFSVYAKSSGTFASFRLGKSSNGSPSSDGSPAEDSGNSNPFRFNFGKLPDVKSLIPVVSDTSSGLSFGNARRKDPNTVFVAGATGQAGIRLAQTLLREGFSVRAGVPELDAAQELARLAAKYKVISNEESKRLNAVESSFQDAESIAKAIGNASKVVITIGAGENGPTSEVTTSDALQVIQAAQLAGVGHVAIVYDGNGSNSSTNNVLDGLSSFFNNLFSRSQALSVVELLQKIVEETDVSYTFIKANLAEDFEPERAYNVVVGAEGSASSNDYKVAKSRIASLVAGVFSNTAVAENKVVEVYSTPSAPSSSVEQLFSAIPTDGRRQAYAEAQAKAKAEEEAIRTAEKAREEAEAAKTQELEAAKAERLSEKTAQAAAAVSEESQKQESDEMAFFNSLLNKAKDFSSEQSQKLKKLSEKEPKAPTKPKAEEAQEKADSAAGSLVNNFLSKAKGFGSQQPWEKLAFQLPKLSEESNVQIATVRGQAKARSLPSKKAAVRQAMTNSKPSFAAKSKENSKPKAKEEAKAEVRKVFGGLFKQETIYVDDD